MYSGSDFKGLGRMLVIGLVGISICGIGLGICLGYFLFKG